MAQSYLRNGQYFMGSSRPEYRPDQYQYGGDSILGKMLPIQRRILKPESQSAEFVGYDDTGRPIYDVVTTPAELGPVERGPSLMSRMLGGLRNAYSAATEDPQAMAGALGGAMQGQIEAAAAGGRVWDPETQQMVEFDPMMAAVGAAPGGVGALRAAEPGSVVLGAMGGKSKDSVLGAIDSRGLAGISDLTQIPDVPQFALERYEPPRGRPSNLNELLTPETARRLTEYAKKGEQFGGREWYNTDPLRLAFVEQLGPEAGNQRYGRFMDIIAATSPRSKVDQNIRRASYLYGEDVAGRPISGLKNTDMPPGYGHLAHETQNYLLSDLAGGSHFQSLSRPKTSSFAENLKGNQTPMTIDTHNFAAITGNLKNKKSPSDTQYKYLEEFQAELADKLNMTPAQWQASVWIGADTGVADTRPFLEVLDDVITRTAERDKKSKREVVSDFITGKSPLYSLVGGAGFGAGTIIPAEDQE